MAYIFEMVGGVSMKNKTLIKANIKRHKATMIGIFVIMLMVSLTLNSVLTLWLNANSYIKAEMERLKYGNITAWTQDIPDQERLFEEINQLQDVETVSVQQLIYSNYKIQDAQSDSEGQLIVYNPQEVPYRIFNDTNDEYQKEAVSIQAGEIYISPSLQSTFTIAIGDEIRFIIGRAGNEKIFTVKGMYEDPFMGTSMIGMKGFLISQNDYDEIAESIEQADMDALARTGQMFHIKQSDKSTLSNTQLNQLLNSETQLSEYTQFVHSKEAISGFMLILQNAFTGLFLSFSLILLIVSIIIVGYSISAVIDQDRKNMVILKTIGYDGGMLRQSMKVQYLMVIAAGLVIGILMSLPTIPMISKMMITFAGIQTPATPQILLWLIILLGISFGFYGFIHLKTRKIDKIPPIMVIQEEANYNSTSKKTNRLRGHWLMLHISIRQLWSAKRRYLSVGITTVLLVFIVSMIGRMNTWLGPDGKGMMDAFNPADLDIGVQLLGQHEQDDMESLIQNHTSITDSYALAMPGITVDGVDYTANVITEPQRFHIQSGSTIRRVNEVVITETIATDRNLHVDDRITISYNGQNAEYQIAGIYQCANEIGGNIGMSQEGFQRIGNVTTDMWCHHYFLEDTSQKQVLIDELNATYGGDVYIHENTWPGLFSIITAMRILLIFMYIVTAIFIMILTILTGNKIFLSEKRNLSIYKVLGFTTEQLRITFAIRYGIIAGLGSMIGILMSFLLTDVFIGNLMKLYGISNFVSHPGVISIIIPGILISALFMLFAYLTSRKMKYLNINELVSD